MQVYPVVVWLKIRKHDIGQVIYIDRGKVVVWLKIRKHDISKLLKLNTI